MIKKNNNKQTNKQKKKQKQKKKKKKRKKCPVQFLAPECIIKSGKFVCA